MKNIRIFCLKIFIILVVKFSIYLNRLVYVMMKNLFMTHLGIKPGLEKLTNTNGSDFFHFWMRLQIVSFGDFRD